MSKAEEKRNLERFRTEQYSGQHQAIASPTFLSTAKPDQPPPPTDTCDNDRQILHFDADAFYCQCEELRDPSNLTGRPVAVTQKYLVVTCNYLARAFGVKKLMSIKDAVAICPELVLINGEDRTPYRKASSLIANVLKRYGPVQKLGLDEMFVDVTATVSRRLERAQDTSLTFEWCGHIHIPGVDAIAQVKNRPTDLRYTGMESTPETPKYLSEYLSAFGNEEWWPRLATASIIAQEARFAIKNETGLRTSAGIACNKLLAKLVSGIHKPFDQTTLLPPLAHEFIASIPLRALPGIGYKTEAALAEEGIKSIHQLRGIDAKHLRDKFGQHTATFLINARWGKDPTPVIEALQKTISIEDSHKSIRGHGAARQLIATLVPDLLLLLQEDESENKRTPTKLCISWRHKGQGWSRSSASTEFPAIHSIDAVVDAACKVLMSHIKKESPFELTLINIAATGFIPVNKNTSSDLLHVKKKPKTALESRTLSGMSPVSLSKLQSRLERQKNGLVMSTVRDEPNCDVDEDDDSNLWDDLADLQKTNSDRNNSSINNKGHVAGSLKNTKASALTALFQNHKVNNKFENKFKGVDGDKATYDLALQLQKEEVKAITSPRSDKKKKGGSLDGFVFSQKK